MYQENPCTGTPTKYAMEPKRKNKLQPRDSMRTCSFKLDLNFEIFKKHQKPTPKSKKFVRMVAGSRRCSSPKNETSMKW